MWLIAARHNVAPVDFRGSLKWLKQTEFMILSSHVNEPPNYRKNTCFTIKLCKSQCLYCPLLLRVNLPHFQVLGGPITLCATLIDAFCPEGLKFKRPVVRSPFFQRMVAYKNLLWKEKRHPIFPLAFHGKTIFHAGFGMHFKQFF